jgi:hypothetical protein
VNYKKTLVIAPAFGYATLPQGVQWMLQSANLHGIEVTLIGRDQPWVDFYDAKISRLWKITKDLTGYDFVIMIDATDTLFATGLGELHTKWQTYNSDFVISGEINNWPWPQRYANHPLKDQRFGGLNSGFYMATWDAFCRTMKHLNEQKDDGYIEQGKTVKNQDQAAFWRAYMEGLPMTIDSRCLLSQATHMIDGRWLLNREMIWGRRPQNLWTTSFPCTFHCNGADTARLQGLVDLLLR